MMHIFEYEITGDFIVSSTLHVLGFYLLYKNRRDLLYDDEDNDERTANTLSPSKCWSWLLFYLAFNYWIRYLLGIIPDSTPFPPGLQEMLYACLLYEFAKKGVDVSKILLRGKLGGGWPIKKNHTPVEYELEDDDKKDADYSTPSSKYPPAKSE